MKRLAILRCGKLPSFVTWDIPEPDELFTEDNLLIQKFVARGLDAQPVVWSDPGIDWSAFDAAIIHSTWDYLDDQQHFLEVLAQIEAAGCRLFNPLPAVHWNINKRYLFDLEKWGVPIVPTFLAAEVNPGSLQQLLLRQPVHSAILKPTIGLGGAYSFWVPVGELDETLLALRTNQPRQEFLVQPFIDNILTEGEWSFVYFNRRLSHVLLKKPAPNDYRVQTIYGGSVQLARPSASELRQAEAVIAKIPFDILYARLDFVRVAGRLSVIEVELIEPIFSFDLAPEGVSRLVEAAIDNLSIKKND